METIFIALNTTAKKVKIAPRGVISGYDGRVFVVDEATIEETKRRGIDIALNVEHCFTDKACKAVGWFRVDSLELADDGVYAVLELTPEGKELIEQKAYRYLSPEFETDQKTRHVDAIVGVALVNTPNFNLEINHKGEQMEIQKELNKKEEQIAALKKELNKKEEQIQKLTDTIKELHLNSAIAAKKILPAEKEHLKSMDLNALQAYLQTREPMDLLGSNIEHNAKEDETAKIAQQLGWED